MTRKAAAFLGTYPRHVVKTLLGKDFEVRIEDVDFGEADYLFFSESDPDHHAARPDVVKIYITGENTCPDFNATDYALSSEYLTLGDRHCRFPYYASNDAALGLNARPALTLDDLKAKPKFCNFIYSNHKLADPIRDAFFHDLNRLRPVSSAGRHLRNDETLAQDTNPDWAFAKRRFMEGFRFTIAFENSAHPGYTTEKLTDALIARTIPIYWGDPLVGDEFNTEALLHIREFPDTKDVIARIEELESSPELMLQVLNAKPCSRDLVLEHRQSARAFLERILDQPKEAARRRPGYGRALGLEKKRRRDQTGWMRRFRKNRF